MIERVFAENLFPRVVDGNQLYPNRFFAHQSQQVCRLVKDNFVAVRRERNVLEPSDLESFSVASDDVYSFGLGEIRWQPADDQIVFVGNGAGDGSSRTYIVLTYIQAFAEQTLQEWFTHDDLQNSFSRKAANTLN